MMIALMDAMERNSEVSNKAMDELRLELASRISHEIRTPLTSIIGFSEFVLEDPSLPEELRQEFVRIIRLEGERLLCVVEQICRLAQKQLERSINNGSEKEFLEFIQLTMHSIDAERLAQSLKEVLSK